MSKKYVVALAFLACVVVLPGCAKKKAPVTEQTPPATVSQSDAPTAPADPTQDAVDHAKKLALLDYATMEDRYMNDPHAQWASSASASSTFGDDNGKSASTSL